MKPAIAAVACLGIVAGFGWGVTHAAEGEATLSPRDYMEIQQLYSRYVRAADMGGAGDGSDWADCFTPDGEFGNAKGSVYALVFNITANPPFVDHSGVYEDWLVKTDVRGRFKKRIFKPNGTSTPSMPE
jgi:hypothetical protein